MIKINLIPFREIEKKENIRRQVTIAILSVILVIVVMAYYYLRLKNTITNMTAKIESTKIELASTELAAKQVDKIKQELNKLNKKIDVIKTIEANRKSSIKLLDNMTKMVDEQATLVAAGYVTEGAGKPVKRLWFTSFQAIGQNLGGRDHTTVHHAHRTIARLADVDPVFRELLDEIASDVKNGGY